MFVSFTVQSISHFFISVHVMSVSRYNYYVADKTSNILQFYNLWHDAEGLSTHCYVTKKLYKAGRIEPVYFGFFLLLYVEEMRCRDDESG